MFPTCLCCNCSSCVQILDESQLSKYQLQNHSITEWTSQQVACWLMGLNLEHHVPQFTAKNIDGEQLILLDSTELKVGFHSVNIVVA